MAELHPEATRHGHSFDCIHQGTLLNSARSTQEGNHKNSVVRPFLSIPTKQPCFLSPSSLPPAAASSEYTRQSSQCLPLKQSRNPRGLANFSLVVKERWEHGDHPALPAREAELVGGELAEGMEKVGNVSEWKLE